MTKLTAARATTTRWDGAATAQRPQNTGDRVAVTAECVDQLVAELLTATRDFVRRHGLTEVEYEVLKAWLIQVSFDDEWLPVLDAFVERSVQDTTGADQEGRKEGFERRIVAELARVRMSDVVNQHRIDRVLATVLFTDIVDSTRHAAELGDRAWLEVLKRHDEVTCAAIARFRGRVVRHTGDGIVATFDRPSYGVHSAAMLAECIPELGIGVRCGLHAGECELRGNDIGGIAVHTGARIAALAHAGEVLVSNTVKDLVNGSGIAFRDRGTHVLKGVPGEWRLFAADPPEGSVVKSCWRKKPDERFGARLRE
jgi:class 3 adenylate cyclase